MPMVGGGGGKVPEASEVPAAELSWHAEHPKGDDHGAMIGPRVRWRVRGQPTGRDRLRELLESSSSHRAGAAAKAMASSCGDPSAERRRRARQTAGQALPVLKEALTMPSGGKSHRRRSRSVRSWDEGDDRPPVRRPPVRGNAFAWVLGGSLLVGGVGSGTAGVVCAAAFVCGTAGGGRWRRTVSCGGCELGFAIAGTKRGAAARGRSLEVRRSFRLLERGRHGIDNADDIHGDEEDGDGKDDDDDDEDIDDDPGPDHEHEHDGGGASIAFKGGNFAADKQVLTSRLRNLLRARSLLFGVGKGTKRGGSRRRGGAGDSPGRRHDGDRREADATAGRPRVEKKRRNLYGREGGAKLEGENSSGRRKVSADPRERNARPLLSKERVEQTREDRRVGVDAPTPASVASGRGPDEFESVTAGRRRCPPTSGRVLGLRDDYKRNDTRDGDNVEGAGVVEAPAKVRHPVLAAAIRVLSEPSSPDGSLPANVELEARPVWASPREIDCGGEGSGGVDGTKESKALVRSARAERQAPLAEVRPPRRSFQLYFNQSAASPLSVITLGSHLFGEMLSLAHAPFASRKEQAAYLEDWVAAAHAHDVVPEDLMPLLPETLRRVPHGPEASVDGEVGSTTDGPPGIEEGTPERDLCDGQPGVMSLSRRDASPDAWWRTYGWKPYGVVANDTSNASTEGNGGERRALPSEGGKHFVGADVSSADAAKQVRGRDRSGGEDLSLVQSTADELMRVLRSVVESKEREGGNEWEWRTAGEVPDGSPDRLSSSQTAPLSSSLSLASPGGTNLTEVLEEAGLSDIWNDASKAEALTLLSGLEDVDRACMVDLLKTVDKLFSAPSPEESAEGTEGGDGEENTGNGDARETGRVGWRVLEAVEHAYRSKARSPRVIVIGDVHGCLDELRRLVREVDYWPGDLLLFLGDLVAKGPDSAGVVKMARELGGVTVRGNHELEVIRWFHLEQSEDEEERSYVRRTRHRQIASSLSPEDANWLLASPWYIASADLDALFVHAGFVPGTRLSEQDPFMMISMRSITSDGVVTSNHLAGEGWARHWDGSKTVFFGHDALRGLQVLDRAVGLDTGCVYGGGLTAYVLPCNEMVRVESNKYASMKQSRRKRPFAETRLKLKPRARRTAKKALEDFVNPNGRRQANAAAAARASPSDSKSSPST